MYNNKHIMECPYCGGKCECDTVDVGVGEVQCGPYICENCGANEIGPEISKWMELNDMEFTMKDGHPFSDEEVKTGFYRAGKHSQYANTVNGRIVDHVTAKEMYNIGLLDEKIFD